MLNLTDYQITAEIYTSLKRIVYRGIRLSDQQPVILKCFSTTYPTPTEIARLKYEYEITKPLNLSGIIKPLALLTNPHNSILILEDIGGLSLKKYLNHHPLELGAFFRIAIQLAQTLGELHQCGIVHKDIKPSNIIFNPETFEVKLTDFAIASQLTKETPSLSHPNLLEGSLAYMSPEQTGRMNRVIDYRSDFYSLGVTFYEMLTGQLPCASDDAMELVHCHIARLPVSPNQVNPQIPQVISDLIMKLLAKTAEDRYQSGFGLKVDLEKCLIQWQEKREIIEFTLATQDFSGQLQIPQKLYGRERELAQLLVAFERVCLGTTEMMLIAGYSGIGKSALVQEIQKPLVRYRGYFISGKFDQFKRNIPYSCLIQAFAELMRQLLTESDQKIQIWHKKILDAVGNNGQVIIDVIPEVELIIGKQPPVPQLGATETQNRFNLFLKKFIHVFTQKEHPLVLFLDDLQWADLASLKLIQLLMTEPDSKYLLLIGAYRDNEVDATHPFTMTLDDIQKSGALVNKITLQPLKLAHANQLIAETLNYSDSRLLQEVGNLNYREKLNSLAELVLNKTNGNPFFLTQLLKSLHQDDLLSFDFSQGVWQWDIERLQAVGITDNVVDLMISQIQKLSEETQNILKLAACIGNRFNLEVLSVVHEKTIPDTVAELWEAVQAGLIIPESNTCIIPAVAYEFEQIRLLVSELEYKFLHDRVQQAAYNLIPEKQKKYTHLKIGQLLLQKTTQDTLEDNIFNIVNQLNIGRELLLQSSEKEELASLNLKVGKKAKAATAYEIAVRYLQVGMALLNADAWEIHYDLTLTLYREATEAAYLNTDFEQMEHLANIVLEQAKTLLEKVKIYEVKILTCIAQKKLPEAVKIGLQVLNLLGVNFPKEPTGADIGQALAKTASLIPENGIEDLINLPEMTEVSQFAALRILNSISSATYLTAPGLYPLIVLSQVDLSIQNGNAPLSAIAYACYGLILCGVVQNIESGTRFGNLALSLLSKFNAPERNAQTFMVVASFIKHWQAHARETLSLFQSGYQSGIETGDLEHAAWNLSFECKYSYFIGQELNLLAQKMTHHKNAINQLKQELQLTAHQIFHQSVLNLLGGSENPCYLIGEAYNEEKFLSLDQEANDRGSLYYLHLNKLILCYLFGEFSQAVANASIAETYLDGATGTIFVPVFHFYDSLARLALYCHSSDSEQHEILEKVNVNQEKMRNWAHHAPMNYQHKYDLVAAEKTRNLGQTWQVMELYERAIKGAREQGYIQEEAITYERAAEFYQALEHEEMSQTYMKRAYHCYERWGAVAKLKNLEFRYPYLISRGLDRSSPHRETITDSSVSRSSSHGNILDVTTVLKASQAIASEINLDNLLAKLMKIVLENAGAQSGVLLLNREGKLFIEASGTIEPEQILVRQSILVEGSEQLPLSAINYVVRTHEDIVLTDASVQGNFTNDSYILAHKTKSVSCTPILSQGKLIGILYLENNLIAGAFTQERTQLLKLLCSQAAISLENAQLYEAQKEYAKTLERQVQERTQELEQQKALFNAFFTAANAGFIITDNELRYVQVNEAIAEINGVLAADHIGRTIWEVVPHLAPTVESIYQQILTTGEPLLNVELSGETASQPSVQRHWIVSYFPLPGLDGKPMGVGVVVVEISDRKRAEAALQQAKEAADAASRAKGEFLSKMSHELRTPLNAILGFSQVLNRDSSLTSQQQEYLGIINRSSEHLLTLINDVLEMSKIEAGRIELRENTFNLYRLLDSLEEMFQFKAESQGLQLTFNMAQDLPQYIRADESKLRQVLINLLGNAIKFTETGTVTLKVSAAENVDAPSPALPLSPSPTPLPIPRLLFEVEDTGPGMAPEELTTLFDPFVQTETGKKSQSGTGLGLPISRQFVQLMGGEITVSSTLNQGTIFTFDIQFSLPEAIDIPTGTATQKAIALEPNQPTYRLLVVEDRPESRLLLVNLLSQVGFEVREVVNGQEAVTVAESWQPHLIWMDMQMPVMDGYEATRQIRARERQNSQEHPLPTTRTIIIALTANAFAEDKATVLSAGCDDFVSKPFREEVIFEKVAHYLGVRYIYEQTDLPSAEKPKAEATSVNFTPESLQGISPEYQAQLYQAAIALDDELMIQLCEQISDSHPQLVKTLLEFTKKLRFDKILAVLEQLPNDERSHPQVERRNFNC